MFLLLAALTTPLFGLAQPWALNFAPPPRIPLVADLDGDGFDDLVSVSPGGDSFIDVSMNFGGQKSARPVQVIANWGKDCQAAAALRVESGGQDSIVGLFGGRGLRLASDFKDGKLKDSPTWLNLPARLDQPVLDSSADRRTLIAFSARSGDGYAIEGSTRSMKPVHLRRGLVWVGGRLDDLYGMTGDGQIVYVRGSSPPARGLPKIDPRSRPAYAYDGDGSNTPVLVLPRPTDGPEDLFLANISGDRRLDLVTFRLGSEPHTANAVTVSPQVAAHGLVGSPGLASGGDGIPDDWKIHGFRGLDLWKLGCRPGQTDIVVFVSRFSDVEEKVLRDHMARATQFYANLPVVNQNGTKGWHFHPIYQDPIPPADHGKSWQENRDKYLPEKYRGLAHWMQVTKGGGGQADELGDGGTCGEGALWQVFVHELGHQLGMDHNGFWGPAFCPIYPSLMNYAYSYSLNDDGNQISYSTGEFNKLVLNETDLDKTLPFPYDKVKFLAKGPYHYRLKTVGDKTQIDWNWDGRFDEHHVRAEINYSYGTSAGPRDSPDKTECAPWTFAYRGSAYVMFGQRPVPDGNKEDPSIGIGRPGSLMVRRLISPLKWEPAQVLDKDVLTGDPVATEFNGDLVAFYPTVVGVVMNRFRGIGGKLVSVTRSVVDSDPTAVVTTGTSAGRLYLFLWNPASGAIRYRSAMGSGPLGPVTTLDQKSTIAPGMAIDTVAHELVLGLAQDQDKKPSRWQIRRYAESGGILKEVSMDWVEGKDGGAAGNGRCTLLFDPSRSASPQGRLLFYCQGHFDKSNPWCCAYVAEQIADKTVHGGWLVKRFYDEWTQTRSAPAAAWWNGDVLYAYRWVDGGQGASDNLIHLGYHGLGIFPDPMGDHDDLTYMKTFGIPYSIVYLGSR